MDNPIYIGLSYQTALRRQMDVVANNVANMNTPGFKGERMLFTEFLTQPATGPKLSMVEDLNTTRDLREGPMQRTDNPLDIALHGDGYFAVETLDGQRYTRTGNFQLNLDRQLVDANGLPVMDDQDRPIVLPQGASRVSVTGDGTISTEQGRVARLKIARFDRPQSMEALPGGLLKTDEQAQPAQNTKVVQGMLEGSNVQGVVEMTSMTNVLRQYQLAQSLIDSEAERQRTAISRLSRVQ